MKLNDFDYALTLLEMMYGIEMDDDDFLEIANIGWKYIGNKRVRTYRYTTCDYNDDGSINLPCNADIIEAVTAADGVGALAVDAEGFTNHLPGPNPHARMVENYIEHDKIFRSPLYISGKFIKYERVGDKIYFDRPHGTILILYRGELLDDNGLPQLTDKEAMALATYCAYISRFKEGLSTNNTNIILTAAALKALWMVLCDLARVDHHFTLNELDEILDAKTNWDRKLYNKSYKLIR